MLLGGGLRLGSSRNPSYGSVDPHFWTQGFVKASSSRVGNDRARSSRSCWRRPVVVRKSFYLRVRGAGLLLIKFGSCLGLEYPPVEQSGCTGDVKCYRKAMHFGWLTLAIDLSRHMEFQRFGCLDIETASVGGVCVGVKHFRYKIWCCRGPVHAGCLPSGRG
ncbi:hypothetical protein L7F22_016395 [Adiantum nelumboides]|nr:hypothetical protein [Adiantum nelumboides]